MKEQEGTSTGKTKSQLEKLQEIHKKITYIR